MLLDCCGARAAQLVACNNIYENNNNDMTKAMLEATIGCDSYTNTIHGVCGCVCVSVQHTNLVKRLHFSNLRGASFPATLALSSALCCWSIRELSLVCSCHCKRDVNAKVICLVCCGDKLNHENS